MELQQLITAVRAWQSLSTKYEAACEEARQINNGMHYPSSPGRRAAIKALDAHAMELIHDVHNEAVLEMLVTLADEVGRLQASAAAQNKRARALRTTVWESTRDAKTALLFLQKKDYERTELILELIRTSNEDALKFDDQIEV